jgi:glycosyltransferase involved in cell wall biosynthesis
MFSIILHTYFRPDLLKESVKAILNQTYDKLEIILIDNGSTKETKEQLYEYERQDKRVKLLHFETNQFSWDDPLKYIDVCFNTALEMSTGDYIWHQEDDDIIAEDYIEKMVNLFQGNSKCISAAGLPVSIDIKGNVKKDEIYERKSNYRSRYMPGHILAHQHLRAKDALFSAPGQIFSFKRDALIKFGGFHKSYEYHQLYGIVPFGITGFDEKAYFYWRRHEGQINKALTFQGWIGTNEIFSMIDDLDIEEKWGVFSKDTARYVVTHIKMNQINAAASKFVFNLTKSEFRGCSAIVRDIWHKPRFWVVLTIRLSRLGYSVLSLQTEKVFRKSINILKLIMKKFSI